jgi:arylsulfatase A-like enzyme
MRGEHHSQRGVSRREMLMRGGSAVAAAGIVPSIAQAAQTQAGSSAGGRPPNILFIMGDDVGIWNISAYHRGMMGGGTPNIDRIAKEGLLFVDHYGQASCTAGRAAFILGQYPIRSGLSTVGLPGAPEGISTKDPTLANLLKPLG